MARKRKPKTFRTPSQRAMRWYKKMEPTTYATYLSRTKDLAFRDFLEYQVIHEQIIRLVREVTSKYGQDYGITQGYMWFAQGIWSAKQRFTSETLQKKADAIFLYWYIIGLKEELMREIALKLGVKISDWDKLLGRVGMSEELIYRGTKRALQETLERVETDLTDAEFYYDANGNLIRIVKYDKITGRRKEIKLTYDAQGNLIKKEEEWV